MVEPPAGKWDMASAWKNATPYPTAAPPVPTGYPITVNSTGISKGVLAGSRSHVDLDEDTTPRSSRWLGVPSYLQPTSFHSQSSRSHSPSGHFPPDPQFSGAGTGQPGDVTPFEAREPVIESEKARTRRRTASFRVTNDPAEHGAVPRPQPVLLAGARRLSSSSQPQSPTIPLGSPLSHSGSLVIHNRPASRSLSTRTGTSSGQRYQEDDAGVSLVIDDGRGSPHLSDGVRSVPPAYVDYRTGYSRADKAPRFERRLSGSVEGTSESGTYIGSGSSNPTRAGSVKVDKPGPSGEGERTLRVEPGSNVEGVVEERDEVGVVLWDEGEVRTLEERDEGEVGTVTDRAVENGGSSAPRTRSGTPHPTVTEAGADDESAARGEGEPDVRDKTTGDDSDPRNRTASRDSEGTIKPGTVEPPGPLERSSTTDLAALTVVNTAANQSTRPDAPGQSDPSPTQPNPIRQASAPAVVTLSEAAESTPAQPAESSWAWGRALGVFGIGVPGASTPPPAKD
ncbi:hypothetical protein FRC06_009197 [Ceratobasidium sp. 370]|nr:hypothetical protein FRC06_009197 [Ceratobasidium sp. 370]